uniref:Galactose oxidase n=1 Tax=Rhizophagus irregularis (strain DAOM 181602 / DAOM 197198 / MUCL 43194) TaxID=747089 RepID=U9THF6_RHIID
MIYKILLIFVLNQLFLLGFGQNYVPEPRVGQAAVIIEDKIYYIGGYKFNQSQPTSDVFYLDVKEFKFTWTDLVSLGANLTLTSWHTASPNGISLDSIFILGGVHLDEANMNYVYKLDIKTNVISVPIIQGKTPQPRQGMNSAVSIEGKIYIFGGYVGSGDNIIFVNSLDILDTINLSWSVGSLVNSPVGRIYYTATLLNDGTIYYIGGKVDRNNFSPMTEIYQYDTIGDKWSLKTATAEVAETMPGPRMGHTAVLGSSKIIVYGGLYYNDDIPYGIPSKETIAMLDITTLVWSIPPLENFNNIPKLAFHSAKLVYDAAMIITFGNNTDIPNSNNQYNRFIYVFYL